MSMSSVPEKMVQDKGDFPPELKLHRLELVARAQAPQTKIASRAQAP